MKETVEIFADDYFAITNMHPAIDKKQQLIESLRIFSKVQYTFGYDNGVKDMKDKIRKWAMENRGWSTEQINVCDDLLELLA
jgi:hypothetical protein